MKQWRADPQGFWAKAAERDRLDPPAQDDLRRRGRRLRPLVSRRDAATPASTRSTAMSPPAAAIRRRSTTTARSPGRSGDHLCANCWTRSRRSPPRCVDFGVAQGDRVIVYMPMIPEAVVAMLACARIGAVHSVVFGGFAAKELATRIDDAEPKLVLTASCGDRARPHRRIQAAARSGDRPRQAQAAGLHRLPAAADRGAMIGGRDHDWDDAGRRGERGGQARALRRTRRDRPALHPLHLRHDRRAQGRGARHRRLYASRSNGR